MSSSITIRCAGRLTPRLLPGSQAVRLRPRQLVAPRSFQPKTTPYLSQSQHFFFSSLPQRQSQGAQTTPPPPPSSSTNGPQPQQGRPSNWRPWILFNLAGLAGAFLVAAVLKSKNAQGGAMNMTSFSPFTITSKEQVSPTVFVLSVRADQGGGSGGGGGGSKSLLLQRAWDHGLWSVEVKQPQLQIARHYTPLPPLAGEAVARGSGGAGSGEGEAGREGQGEELRFLIRKVDGGEMSTYLSKLQVGEKVWLRGPHLGFDVERRLGDVGRHVVFLAGGTGIAPALQVARKVLDGHSAEAETAGERKGDKPTVSILWANRHAADALGRQQQNPPGSGAGKGSSWFSRSAAPTTPSDAPSEQQPTQIPAESTLAHQIRELQAKHPDHFRISYFVDEERRFIEERDLRLALANPSPAPSAAAAAAVPPTPPSMSCTWHSPKQLVILPDDNDLGRFSMPCACVKDTNTNTNTKNNKNNNSNNNRNGKSPSSVQPGAGADLICVSGPDGFVAAYAGPKRWFGGTERQGPVRGVLEQVVQDGKVKAGEGEGEEKQNWLVLKL
ncbi:uncharacterized protein F4812DRAFT_457115 [Daldinia caldariorum]|uniref:uncharacterized protein n=1 Tax=Daldinia caldariorum TaxID=326644 RepID=UPI0020074539|nr:uncharacterized protein F4812DRAFT_457115 [Daldinia caldariorum]KAI1469713.1 hypothetical protein F4812DRAFT_457115 [Daldinia caldariorum]